MTFPLPLPSPSIYHYHKGRICLCWEDETDGYSQTVLVWVMTQYSILSEKLIFDGLFRLYFHCPHSTPLVLLTFFPFLFKSYSSFKTSSVASHLLHEALSITWPPHPELRIPTWIPLALKKWFTSNTHLIIVIPLPVCLLYHTVSSSSAGIVCLPAPPTLQPISADSLWVFSSNTQGILLVVQLSPKR